MGKDEEPKKSSPTAMDQNHMHLYPDWATMPAFYGPRFAVPPPPYMNSPVASPHVPPPPYMWPPPQSMMPPYGAPYAAFYPHGGIYAHPGIPLAGSSVNIESPTKSSAAVGLVKKLNESDRLSISIGNQNSDGNEHESDRKLSNSDETDGTDGSSDGSNGDTPRSGQNGKKKSGHASPKGEHEKAQKKSSLAGKASEMNMNVVPVDIKLKNTNTLFDLKDPSIIMSSPIDTPLLSITNESWLQNERVLKREKRKQSNRESARRSRLRKQAETDELAVKVQFLTADNLILKSEVNKLTESSEKLKLENAALMGKLELNVDKIDVPRPKPVGTVNLLARVNNSDSSDRMDEETDDSYNHKRPGTELHQVLGSSSRSNAVAAG